MHKKKADEIFARVKKEWIRRHGEDNLDPEKLAVTRKMIDLVPDEDGCKRVTLGETGKTYLVPIETIILDGLKGTELEKYP